MSRALARSRQLGADLIGIVGILSLFGYAAEAAGLDAIVGGLVALLIVGDEKRFREVEIRDGIAGLTYGVFIPLFFVNVGAWMDPTALLGFDPPVFAVVAVGVIEKVGGSYLGARAAGHPSLEVLVVGVGTLPRAGVELVMITEALAAGVIDRQLFSAVLGLVLATPPLLKRAVRRVDDPRIP